jgi:hypothetical protein
MFGFHGHKFRVNFAVGHQIGKMFRDMRLGCNGINGRHIYIAQPDGFRYGNCYFHSYALAHVIPPPPLLSLSASTHASKCRSPCNNPYSPGKNRPLSVERIPQDKTHNRYRI